MAHSANIISAIKLPDNITYQIHDAEAIHSIEDLGLSAALKFMGTKTSESAITGLTNAKVGEVWLCTANNLEYVCVTAVNGTANANAWEKLGNIHDAASSTHTHTVSVSGSNEASTVTGTVTIPTVSATKKYLKASAAAPSLTPSTDAVLGKDTTFAVDGGKASTTYIKASASGTAIGANGTVSAITDLGTPSTDTVIGAEATLSASGGTASTSKMVTTTINNPTVTNVTIPNVTGNTFVSASKVKTSGSVSAGVAPTWSASVDNNGILSFSWGAGTPTAVTLPTFDTVTASHTTLSEEPLSASKVSTSNVTVATGGLASNGSGSSVVTGVSAVTVGWGNKNETTVVTGYSEPDKSTVLTGVKVTAQPTISLSTDTTSGTGKVQVATGVSAINVTPNTNDQVTALTGVSAGAPTITLTEQDATSTGAIGYVSNVSVGSTAASLQNGSAAAQKWSATSASTGAPQN